MQERIVTMPKILYIMRIFMLLTLIACDQICLPVKLTQLRKVQRKQVSFFIILISKRQSF